MEKCRFSIIVPVYNVETYLGSCVNSLMNQDYGNYEILLINDGSTDESGRICDYFSSICSKIKVFHCKNKGVSAARNYGVSQAQGEYLIFADSDDRVESDLCSHIDAVLKRTGDVDVVAYNGWEENQMDKTRKTIKETGRKDLTVQDGHDYLLDCYRKEDLEVVVWLYCLRREYVEQQKLQFIEGIYHEDVEFVPRALLAAEKIVETKRCLYHYRVRPGSISTHNNKQKNVKDLFYVLELQNALANQQQPELRKWMKNSILNSGLSMIMEAQMYRPEYRKLFHKSFLLGKAATGRNHIRAILCAISVPFYCKINSYYKSRRK